VREIRREGRAYHVGVLLVLQSLSDVRDGLDGRLELVGQREVAAGPVDELPHVRAHTVRLKPEPTHKQTERGGGTHHNNVRKTFGITTTTTRTGTR